MLRSAGQGLSAPLLFVFGFYFFLVGSKVFLATLVGKSRVLLTKKGYIGAMRVLGCLLALLAVVLLKDALSFLGVFRR